MFQTSDMIEVLKIALGEYGIKERRGGENISILRYFIEIGHPEIKEDEISWCSAFVNWCCMRAGLPFTGSLAARSWLAWGEKVKDPILGDIAIFSRGDPDGWEGHVGIFIRQTGDGIFLLGGNQTDSVNITWFPGTRLLGYRRMTT